MSMSGNNTKHTPATTNQAITYAFLVNDAKALLYDCSETPRIDAEILMQHITKQPLSWLISYSDSIASAEHIKLFYQLVAKRKQCQPVAYLIGERDFWSLTLTVNEHVLIPRPDTETLIEAALPLLSSTASPCVLDLGTGTGAIALSLAKECPSAAVTAIDYHNSALNVAKHNAKRNNIKNVAFIKSDWFNSLSSDIRFDLITSNPPYIDSNDCHLEQGDLRFEPINALVAEENGLADLSTIIKTAPDFLKPNGWLIIEHGYNQATEVEGLFTQHGFSSIALHHDLNELPRCTLGQYNNTA